MAKEGLPLAEIEDLDYKTQDLEVYKSIHIPSARLIEAFDCRRHA